jgi:hypothetical protein
MAQPAPAVTLSLQRARAAWIAAQEIGRGEALVPTLERTGFVRTLGGTEVYLAMRGRLPSLPAADLHAAVSAGRAQVVPAVRGCIYLVARRYVPLALRVADLLSRRRDDREHEKAGIRPGELDAVGVAVVDTLKREGPLTTDALRKAVPPSVVRSLGDQGKKIGISSTLPPALRRLEFAGKIERTLEGGRLDSERYIWRAAAKSPFDGVSLPDDPIALWAELATIFFRAAGTGTVRDFSEWAGIGLRDAARAAEKAKLIPVAVEGIDEPSWAVPEREPELRRDADVSGAAGLLPFEDNVVALHGGPAHLVDPAHHGLSVPSWGSSAEGPLGAAKHMQLRPVVAEGRVVGLWEYDPDPKSVALGLLDSISAGARSRLDDLARSTGRFLAEEIGHGRSFTLDTDDDLRKRATFVRGLKPTKKAVPAEKPAAAPKKKPAGEPKPKTKIKKPAATAKTKKPTRR